MEQPPLAATGMRMDGSYKDIEILDDKGLNVSLRTMTASQGGQRRCDGSATFTQVTTRGRASTK